MTFSSLKQKCICQICVCGRHRCPHNRGSIGRDSVSRDTKCLLTEYQFAYAELPAQPRRHPLRPPVRERMGKAAMSTNTTYGKTYTKHQPCAHIVKKKHEYKPPGQTMNKTSTYGDEYSWKDGKRAESFMPENAYVKSSTPFCKESVYRVNYGAHSPKDWAWCRAEPFKHKECIQMSDARFDASTTMEDDFIAHENAERVHPVKPTHPPVSRISKFTNSTSYNLEFTPKRLTSKTSQKKPVEYRPNTAEFYGTTTAQNDYQDHPYQQRRASFKPDLQYKPSNSPMETKTTVKEAFQPWPIQTRQLPGWARQRTYTAPTQSFEKNSSYQESYKQPVNFERAKLAKPRQNGLDLNCDVSGKKADKTHYQEQYVPYGHVDKPQSFKKTQKYQPPTESMMRESDYQANYKGEPSERARPCTPGRKARTVRAPFEHDTTYNSVFTGQGPPDCPAKIITDVMKDTDKNQTHLQKIGAFTAEGVKDGHYFFATSKNKATKFADDEPPEKTLQPSCTCKPAVTIATQPVPQAVAC